MSLNFDECIKRDNTGCLKYDGRVRFGMAKDIFPMWIADMDFHSPDVVRKAVLQRAGHNLYGYNLASESYFSSIINWMEKKNFIVKPGDITVCSGVVTAIAFALRALLKPGEAVIIQPPVYGPFRSITMLNGYNIVENRLKYVDGKYIIDFDDFEQKIKDNGVKVFILCNPHNPVGRVWTKDELKSLADICLRLGVYVITDEIHGDIVYSPHVHTPFASVCDGAENITIACTAPTKTFNLAGMKIANTIIQNDKLMAAYKAEGEKVDVVSLNSFAYGICESVYSSEGQAWLSGLIEYLEGNVKTVENFIKTNLDGIKVVRPEATYLMWLDCTALNISSTQLKEKMVACGLWLDYGSSFSPHEEDGKFIRINIALCKSGLEKALEKFKTAFAG